MLHRVSRTAALNSYFRTAALHSNARVLCENRIEHFECIKNGFLIWNENQRLAIGFVHLVPKNVASVVICISLITLYCGNYYDKIFGIHLHIETKIQSVSGI